MGSWVQSKFSENDHSWISYSDIIYFILIPLVPSPIFLPRIDMMFSIYSRIKVWWRSVNLKNNFSSFVFGAMKFQEKKAFGIYWPLGTKRKPIHKTSNIIPVCHFIFTRFVYNLYIPLDSKFCFLNGVYDCFQKKTGTYISQTVFGSCLLSPPHLHPQKRSVMSC